MFIFSILLNLVIWYVTGLVLAGVMTAITVYNDKYTTFSFDTDSAVKLLMLAIIGPVLIIPVLIYGIAIAADAYINYKKRNAQ